MTPLMSRDSLGLRQIPYVVDPVIAGESPWSLEPAGYEAPIDCTIFRQHAHQSDPVK
jgi:hypothetical protein